MNRETDRLVFISFFFGVVTGVALMMLMSLRADLMAKVMREEREKREEKAAQTAFLSYVEEVDRRSTEKDRSELRIAELHNRLVWAAERARRGQEVHDEYRIGLIDYPERVVRLDELERRIGKTLQTNYELVEAIYQLMLDGREIRRAEWHNKYWQR